VPKSLQIDEDKLRTEFSAVNVNFNSLRYLGLSSVILSQFTLELWIAAWNREKNREKIH